MEESEIENFEEFDNPEEKTREIKMRFTGSSPPEIFVGRFNYPNVFSGIIAPPNKRETEIHASPEKWFAEKLSIKNILDYRRSLIYARRQSNVRSVLREKQLHEAVQEIALSSRPVSTEFFLEKKPILGFEKIQKTSSYPLLPKPVPVKKVRLEENPKVPKKVDYLVSDYNAKATNALEELYENQILVSHLYKLLSAGLLGIKMQRKMVPTRWSITAVDDILSKKLLERIKYYPEINEVMLFSSEYNGNHYEILLLPDKFSFEVIEAELKLRSLQSNVDAGFMQDYESFFGRKNYASNVTGAYYANRLGVSEYLEKIKKQATALVFREVRPEYYAPLGVGILREATRDAFVRKPERFSPDAEGINNAFAQMQKRTRLDSNFFREKSILLQDYGKQKRLKEWF